MSTLPSSTDDDEKTPNRPLIHSKETWFKENFEQLGEAIDWVTDDKVEDKVLQYFRQMMTVALFFDFVHIVGGGTLTNDEIAILKSSNKYAASMMNECVQYLANVGVPKGLDKERFDKWRSKESINFIKNYKYEEFPPNLSNYHDPIARNDFAPPGKPLLPARYRYPNYRTRVHPK